MGLTQLDTLDLHLADFSTLPEMPLHVTSLGLRTWKLLDMATALPCLQTSSGLKSLVLDFDAGVHSHCCFECPSKLYLITVDFVSCRG